MGQVIKVDFAARVTEAQASTPDHSIHAATSVVPFQVNRTDNDSLAEAPASFSVRERASAELPSPSVSTASSRQPTSLTEACARMRSDTEALKQAIENLKRATSDLDRLPAMARELCEAVV